MAKREDVITGQSNLGSGWSSNLSSTFQLDAYINDCIRIALQNTLDRMVQRLKEIIDKNVYKAYTPIFYERTNQLREAWGNEIQNTTVLNFDAKIEHLSEMIIFEPMPFFEHGSYISAQDYLGNPEAIPYIVDSGNIGNAFGFPQLGAREFWKDFYEYFKANLIPFMKSELRHQGLKVIG